LQLHIVIRYVMLSYKQNLARKFLDITR